MSAARVTVLLVLLRSRSERLAASRAPVGLMVAGLLAAVGGTFLLSAGWRVGAVALAAGLVAALAAYGLLVVPDLLHRGSVLLLAWLLNRPSSPLAPTARSAVRSLLHAPDGEVFRRSRAAGVLGAMRMAGFRSELVEGVASAASSSAPAGGEGRVRAALAGAFGADAELLRDDAPLWDELSLVLSRLSPARSALVAALSPLLARELWSDGPPRSSGRRLLTGLLLLAGQVGGLSDAQALLARRLLASGWGRTSAELLATVRHLCD